jgi:hypothetical protein
MANEVTRDDHGNDYYHPIAKLYLGYLAYPTLRSWDLVSKQYQCVCDRTLEMITEMIREQEEYDASYGQYPLEPCDLAGVVQEFERRAPDRCRSCRHHISCDLTQTQHYIAEDASEVPLHLNEAMDFLQRMFEHLIWGNISSVLGGVDLRVMLHQERFLYE